MDDTYHNSVSVVNNTLFISVTTKEQNLQTDMTFCSQDRLHVYAQIYRETVPNIKMKKQKPKKTQSGSSAHLKWNFVFSKSVTSSSDARERLCTLYEFHLNPVYLIVASVT